VNLLTIMSKERAVTNGLMGDNTMVIGCVTICTDLESLLGLVVNTMRENIKMINSTVMES
jgi:hypothetical protein